MNFKKCVLLLLSASIPLSTLSVGVSAAPPKVTESRETTKSDVEFLSLEQAKERFKTDEDAVSYLIIVECYEKYLHEEQRQDFLSAQSIEEMLNVLDENQLRHLKDMVMVFEKFKACHYPKATVSGGGLSAWFLDNMEKLIKSKHMFEIDLDFIHRTCHGGIANLLKKITKIGTKKDKYKKDIIARYRSNLKKFDGDSMEYRQWLFLDSLLLNDFDSETDEMIYVQNPVLGLSFEDKIYDITKYLRKLSLNELDNLETRIFNKSVVDCIRSLRYREPYFFNSFISKGKNMEFKYFKIDDRVIGEKDEATNPEVKAFIDAKNRLLSRIRDAVNEKEGKPREESYFFNSFVFGKGKTERKDFEICDRSIDETEETMRTNIRDFEGFRDTSITVAREVKNEKDDKKVVVKKKTCKSKVFEKDMMEIMRSLENVDDISLKNAISLYSKPGVYGNIFNYKLRRNVFSKKIKSFSVKDIMLFRKQIAKTDEYFSRHLTDKDYIVYRGMSVNGLVPLLRTAYTDQSKLDLLPHDKSYEQLEEEILKNGIDEKIIKEINEKKPIVFDEGLTSSSLIEFVASNEFGGKNEEGVFFTIKVPKGSKALILDYEDIENIPWEEEMLFAPRTKMKINSIKKVVNTGFLRCQDSSYYEIEAEVVND